MEFVFTKKAKRSTFLLMALGVISVVAGIFTADGDHFWSNILVNSFFFLAIGLGALFFYALQYATETGWSALVKRIFEGIYSSIPVFGGILAIVLLVGSLGGHHIYHWMDPHVYEPLLEDGTPNEHYDAIIANKKPFLNLPFFWFRTLVYLATFILFARFFRKKSLQEDEVGGNEIHKLLYRRGALFLVFFAVFSSTLSWDWLMSIDTHWFSTMYGWYTFSGMWVSAMITAILLIRWLKGKGYLPYVNENHIHDLGKWMFALSFLWTYLWFSQFMLIWYSDIPEEVTYFKERIDDFTIPYFLMLAVNFIFPMVMLMSRQAKRTNSILLFVGGLIFLGHWFDVYLMVIPGATHHWHYGLFEAGTFLGFLGLFLYMTLNAFTKASFLPKNHPFLEESKHMHI